MRSIIPKFFYKGISLYCGNIPWGVTEESMIDFFHGVAVPVEVNIARFEDSKRSKGWCTVVFSSIELAKKAIEFKNRRLLNGRKVFIRFEQNRTDHDPTFNIFIGNISFKCHEDDMENMVKDMGAYDFTIKRKRDGRTRGFAIAKFDTKLDAENAMSNLNGKEYFHRLLSARWDTSQPASEENSEVNYHN